MADRVRAVPAYGDEGRSGAYEATGVTGGAAVAWIARTDEPVIAAPVLAGDALVVADAGGTVYAFDAGTGAERWRYAHRAYDDDLGDEYDDGADRDDDWICGMDDDEPGVVTAPAVWDTWVFVEEGESTGWVYVHDLASGAVVHIIKDGGCPTVLGDTLLLQEIGAGARVLRLPELTRVWRGDEERGEYAGWLRVSPAVAGGAAYAALGYEPRRTHTGVTAFDVGTGAQIFHRAGGDRSGEALSFDTAHAVAAGGLVWMPAVRYGDGDDRRPGNQIMGLDPRSGRTRWVFVLGSVSAAQTGAVAVGCGTVYFTASVGDDPVERLYAVDVDARRPRWSVPLAGGRVGSPVLAGGMVLLAGREGTVSAFDVRDGALCWTAETGEEILGLADLREDESLAYYEEDGQAVLPGDGVVYVRTAAGVAALR